MIVPNALTKQHKVQAGAWLPKGACDILICGGPRAGMQQFWAADGPYQQSKFVKSGDLHRVIIITTINVCGSTISSPEPC